MGKGARLKMQKDKELPEGTYRLTRLQVAAISGVQQKAAQLAKARKEWEEYGQKVLVPMEAQLGKESDQVFDELCEAHGLERDGRSLEVSKDLTTFTLKETTDEQEEKAAPAGSAGTGILDANGNPVGGTVGAGSGLSLVRGITPGEPGKPITPEGAGKLLQQIGALGE
jgi:TolA-binding protein